MKPVSKPEVVVLEDLGICGAMSDVDCSSLTECFDACNRVHSTGFDFDISTLPPPVRLSRFGAGSQIRSDSKTFRSTYLKFYRQQTGLSIMQSETAVWKTAPQSGISQS
mmetsp:Transcript_77672/g.209398  ORF Transcript_77672/g.209398 Transcript_77672/m.209398 type:complete len:109 (-) Transcript_77672:30-356(-)